MSRMNGRNLPSNWRLWHPNQGLVFQQPLYPNLDAARFFTEASTVEEIGTGLSGAQEEVAPDVSSYIEESKTGRRKSISREISKEYDLDEASTTTTHLATECMVTKRTETHFEEVGSNGPDGGTATDTEAVVNKGAPSGPSFTPLDYKIPEDVFQAASAADEGSPESFWSYTLYRGPNGEKDNDGAETKVKVHYCKSAHTAERVLQYFLEEKVIGFDLEWCIDAYKYPTPRRCVSLVQIASQSRIALLHLALYPSKDELATPTLRKIMESTEITKVGVWIKGDCNRVEKYLGIKSRGIFELSHMFRQVKYSANGRLDLINKKLVSLADQVKEILRLPLFKGQDVRASNWSQALSMEQIGYSASDAYAAVHLFAALNLQRESLDPTPPLPFHSELDRPIPLALGIQSSSSDEADAAGMDAELEAEAESALETSGTLSPETIEAKERRLKELKARLNKVRETIQVEEDEDEEPPTSKPAAKPSTPKKVAAKASKPAPPLKDPRVMAAEVWLMEYKATLPHGKPTAGAAALRAYFLWHANIDLDPASIGTLLREPPLQIGTVTRYILEAVKQEKLPYDKVRLKTEVLDGFPRDVAQKAYGALVRAVEDVAVPSEDGEKAS